MAEKLVLKRPIDQEIITSDDQENMKRQRVITSASSYNQILSLLDEEFCEEEPNQDCVSSFITTLQKELFSDDTISSSSDPLFCSDSIEAKLDCVDQELKHLFEASDDDLGIVSHEEESYFVDDEEQLLCGFDGGLWEFEDHESANYYSMIDILL